MKEVMGEIMAKYKSCYHTSGEKTDRMTKMISLNILRDQLYLQTT